MFFRLKKTILLIVFISISNNVFADGSIYSLRGQGLLYYYYGGRATGMGGAVVAVSDLIDLNWLNPASLASISYVRVSSQFLMQNLNIENSNQTFKTNYSNFNGFMGAFPVAKNVGIGFGLQPISKINYSFESPGKIDVHNYTESVNSLGGLNQFFVAGGFNLFSKLQFGVRFGYIFGKADEDWRVSYVSPSFISTFDQFRSKYKGLSTTMGVILKPISQFSIGAIYQNQYNLNQNFEVFHDASKITTGSTTDLKIPALWGGGISYLMKERFLWALDYVSQDWSSYPSGSANSSEFTSFNRLSFGLEITPSLDRFTNFWKSNKYRLGFALEQPYVLDYTGKELSTYLITAGVGVPFAGGSGSIDLAIEYGQRGSLPENSFKEQIFRFSLYVTGRELWFQR